MQPNSSEQIFLEKYKKSILRQAISIIYENRYEISELSKNEILNLVFKPKTIKRCIGISSTFTQCSLNSLQDKDYCKKHLKYTPLILEKIDNINQIKNISNKDVYDYKKIFFNDSFYFIDSNYIYDIKDNEKIGEKVGIISKKEMILTSDPFILNSI